MDKPRTVRLKVQMKEGVGKHHVRAGRGFVTYKGGDIFEIDEARVEGIKDKVTILERDGKPIVVKPSTSMHKEDVAARGEESIRYTKDLPLKAPDKEENKKVEEEKKKEEEKEEDKNKVTGLIMVSLGEGKYNILNGDTKKPINDRPLSEEEAKALMP